MSTVFVTGTGTDVGKTFVTAALIRELRRRGRGVDALKPVASGFDPARAGESDPGILLGALGEAPVPEALARVAPWRFAAPLSPDMAAQREKRAIDFDALVAFSRRAMAAAKDVLLIEGVGGIMVPLDERRTVLDWMAALRSTAIVVGGSYLGAINHALTTLEVLAVRGLVAAALVVDETPQSGVALDETAAEIARFARGVPVLALPRLSSADEWHPTIKRVADLL